MIEDPVRTDVRISLADSNAAAPGIRVEDCLFRLPESEWLSESSMPRVPLPTWQVEGMPPAAFGGGTLPVIFGSAKPASAAATDADLRVPIDIFGSIFFMLTRYEEAVRSVRDAHGRFPAAASLAGSEGFVDRPIVDEYTEYLWRLMKGLWPRLDRRIRQYCLALTHDVDWPYLALGQPLTRVVRGATGDLVKRKDLRSASRRLRSRLLKRPQDDPANTFQFIMSESEKHAARSDFYFRAEGVGEPTATYSLDDRPVQALITQIHERGHRLGLHTSYASVVDPARTKTEFERLRRVTEHLGILQGEWGGRQHFLRWENPITWNNWESAGLSFDSTLGFADRAGFRCGTCHEYPVFDLRESRQLGLRERPLVVMDGALSGPGYMALKPEDGREWILRLANACRIVDGVFVLLWHNTQLMDASKRAFYSDLLGALAP